MLSLHHVDAGPSGPQPFKHGAADAGRSRVYLVINVDGAGSIQIRTDPSQGRDGQAFLAGIKIVPIIIGAQYIAFLANGGYVRLSGYGDEDLALFVLENNQRLMQVVAIVGPRMGVRCNFHILQRVFHHRRIQITQILVHPRGWTWLTLLVHPLKQAHRRRHGRDVGNVRIKGVIRNLAKIRLAVYFMIGRRYAEYPVCKIQGVVFLGAFDKFHHIGNQPGIKGNIFFRINKVYKMMQSGINALGDLFLFRIFVRPGLDRGNKTDGPYKQ